MVVLLTGATGFIGWRLVEALVAAGHEVICAVRRADGLPSSDTRIRCVEADFTRDLEPAAWLPRLAGVDVVINAVGIFREGGSQTFDLLHVAAPQALFSACVEAGVRRVVQISALGADERASSRYHLSKKAADDFLAKLPLEWIIVQPSLVYGPGGPSARLFTLLASLPCIPLPGRGDQRVQPVHLEDAVQAIVSLAEGRHGVRRRIALVGPEALLLRDYLGRLREAMGLPRACFLPLPMSLVRLGARLAARLPSSLLDPEALDMLVRGNTADAAHMRSLLGRAPRPVQDFVPRSEARHVRTDALLRWLLPVLRVSIALVWIVTGIVSLGLYPVEESYALLARTGVTGPLAPLLLYGAAVLDLMLGIATLALRRRRLLWLVQTALILGYTLIITVALPEFWLHPYGPVLKNLPMLAAIWLLYELEPR